MQVSTLRPGLLVSLKTSTRGNVAYIKNDIERDHTTKDGKRRAKWQTERTIADPEEFELAQTARSKANNIIRGICSVTAFGLLCPESEAGTLEQAIADARKVVDAFNVKAKITHLSVNVIAGRIAPDDIEAVRAINSEVRDLLEEMKEGIKTLDVKAIREAASRTRGLGQMLTPEAQARIQIAIDVARKTARQITKAGEQAAQEIDKSAIRKITETRSAFLDLDPTAPMNAPKAVGVAIDLAPEGEAVRAPKRERPRLLDA